jgi:hypothetical protein
VCFGRRWGHDVEQRGGRWRNERFGPSSEEGTSSEGPSSEESGETTAAGDAGTESSEPSDAGDESSVELTEAAAAPIDASADAAAEGDVTSTEPDGSVEGDPTTEGAIDAGPWCGNDMADESFVGNCWDTFISACSETEAGASGTYSYSNDYCVNAGANYRGPVADAFWDCYADAGVEDPCSDAAYEAVLGCDSAAIEGACVEARTECDQLAGVCGEITKQECEAAVAPYNSVYIGNVATCFVSYVDAYGPDFEGCGSAVYSCIASPSGE